MTKRTPKFGSKAWYERNARQSRAFWKKHTKNVRIPDIDVVPKAIEWKDPFTGTKKVFRPSQVEVLKAEATAAEINAVKKRLFG